MYSSLLISFHLFLLSSPSLCYLSICVAFALSGRPPLLLNLSFLLHDLCFLFSAFCLLPSAFFFLSLLLFYFLYLYIKRHHLICKQVVLRDYEEQKKLNRTSYDLVTKDGKVLPKPGPNFEGIQSLSSLLLLCLPPLKEE